MQLPAGLRELTRRTLLEQERDRRAISLRLQDNIAQTLLGVHVQILLLQKEARSQTVRLEKDIAETLQWLTRATPLLARRKRPRKDA
ncbi:hypothetical protein [Verrucomicrobium sp. GAS474]|uniref:hypothetical protein n=1 Tax=Verrucomicrobium sp. GAS474 TaxID=1882831 RepID=UPI0012FF7F3E|nr:hypothetical protein [Verrucomicrobium sp. GAS474]